MAFEVDFVKQSKNKFQTLYTAFVEATSVTECIQKANELVKEIPQLRNEEFQILVEEL